MALQHGEIPGQLHLEQPNPFIPWDRIAVRVPTRLTPWPTRADGRRIGGVSSFGFSGTNVHLILEAAPEREHASPEVERPLHIVTASARQESALRAVLQQQRDRLAVGRRAAGRLRVQRECRPLAFRASRRGDRGVARRGRAADARAPRRRAG